MPAEVPYHSIPLDRPRPLSPRERALLHRLLDHPAATPELHHQADAARVSEVCSCGCPSITLVVPDDAPVARLDRTHPDVRHGEDLTIDGYAQGPEGRQVQVNLHVLGGRLFELEIWAGADGGDPRVALPEPSTVEVGG